MNLLGMVRNLDGMLEALFKFYTREVESLKKEAFSLERFPIWGAFSISSVVEFCVDWTGLDWSVWF
jgi:hypothetical protein